MNFPDSPLPPHGESFRVASVRAAQLGAKFGRRHLASLFVHAHDGPVSRDVFCVAPKAVVEILAALLIERRWSALFVIDGGGRIVGVMPAEKVPINA